MASNAYRVLRLVFAWGRDAVLQRQREEIEALRMRAEDEDVQMLPDSRVVHDPDPASKASIQQQREELEGRKMDLEERLTRAWNYEIYWDARAEELTPPPMSPVRSPRPHMLGYE